MTDALGSTRDTGEPHATMEKDIGVNESKTRKVIPHPFCWRGRSDGNLNLFNRDTGAVYYEDMSLPYEQPMRTVRFLIMRHHSMTLILFCVL